MKTSLKTLVLTSAAFCATAAFAANQARVTVPFSFTAKGQSYPSGTYEVVLDSSANYVSLQNQTEPSKHLGWMVGPSEPAKSPAVVRFDEVGSDYTLKNIQIGNHITPNLDPKVKGVSATTTISGQ
jgi:hypothetical protein